MAAMKWWGWGSEGVEFSHEDKPELGPFIAQAIGVDLGARGEAPVRFDQLKIPESKLPPGLREALKQAVTAPFVSVDPLDRVVHARGKSLRDLIRQRHGELARVPDVIVRPGDEDQVTATVQAALDADAVVIPLSSAAGVVVTVLGADGPDLDTEAPPSVTTGTGPLPHSGGPTVWVELEGELLLLVGQERKQRARCSFSIIPTASHRPVAGFVTD